MEPFVLFQDMTGEFAPLSNLYALANKKLVSRKFLTEEILSQYCPQCCSVYNTANISNSCPFCAICPICASVVTIVTDSSAQCYFKCSYCIYDTKLFLTNDDKNTLFQSLGNLVLPSKNAETVKELVSMQSRPTPRELKPNNLPITKSISSTSVQVLQSENPLYSYNTAKITTAEASAQERSKLLLPLYPLYTPLLCKYTLRSKVDSIGAAGTFT